MRQTKIPKPHADGLEKFESLATKKKKSFLIVVYDINIMRQTRIPKPHADGMEKF